MAGTHVDLSFFKVLAIARNGEDARAMSTALAELRTPFKITSSDAEAIEVLNGERFDLALAETGEDIQAIRAADASFRNMPVVVYTASTAGVPGSLEFRQLIQERADQIFAALPVLEESSIDKIRMFDDEEHSLLTSLFQIYSESTRDELREIEQLVQQQDFPLLRKKAHKLKSSAAQLGAFRFEKYCTLMEYDAALDQARAQKLFEEMTSEYQNSLVKFDLYCQKHAGL